ncbi:MAG: T9SS type A sorting domain-containing protein [Bacteroidota bacterium]
MRIIILAFLLLTGFAALQAQYCGKITIEAGCSGSGFKSGESGYQMGYKYRESDSTLFIKGYLGNENCGIQHHFSVEVDSNRVVLSETIIDTILATCTCNMEVEIRIDSFYFEEFTVEFEGEYLMDLPRDETTEKIRLWPNPAGEVVYLYLPGEVSESEVDMYDLSGRLIRSWKFGEGNPVALNTDGCRPGCYLIRIRKLNISGKLFVGGPDK